MKLKIKKKFRKSIPKPAISRLCRIFNLLEDMKEKDQSYISSKEIGKKIGAGSHNIRKDIGYLKEIGISGSGYEIARLKKNIEEILGFNMERRACVIGLSGLGQAILNNKELITHSFKIVAGFDSNINKIETIKTEIPVYPTYEITDVVKRDKIELAVMNASLDDSQKFLSRLIEGGIKGIVNLSSFILNSPKKDVYIANIDLIGQFRFLSALFTLGKKQKI